MIVKKIWIEARRGGMLEWKMEGWFLFGVLPLYTRDCAVRVRIAR